MGLPGRCSGRDVNRVDDTTVLHCKMNRTSVTRRSRTHTTVHHNMRSSDGVNPPNRGSPPHHSYLIHLQKDGQHALLRDRAARLHLLQLTASALHHSHRHRHRLAALRSSSYFQGSPQPHHHSPFACWILCGPSAQTQRLHARHCRSLRHAACHQMPAPPRSDDRDDHGCCPLTHGRPSLGLLHLHRPPRPAQP